MKKTSVNNKKGFLVFKETRNRGSFCTRESGEKRHGGPWKHVRIFDMMKVDRKTDGGHLVYRRRGVTDYDRIKSKMTVTNHTDVVFEAIPELCLALMELYKEEMGITKAELDVEMQQVEEKDMDQVDILMKKIGGGIG